MSFDGVHMIKASYFDFQNIAILKQMLSVKFFIPENLCTVTDMKILDLMDSCQTVVRPSLFAITCSCSTHSGSGACHLNFDRYCIMLRNKG